MNSLRSEYLFARRRYRFVAGKFPRHRRFPRRKGGFSKGYGKGNGKQSNRCGHSYFGKGKGGSGPTIGPSSFAGGKGFGDKAFGNPKDKQGNVLECHGCGSKEHLINRCPTKGKRKGVGVSMLALNSPVFQGVYTESHSTWTTRPLTNTSSKEPATSLDLWTDTEVIGQE